MPVRILEGEPPCPPPGASSHWTSTSSQNGILRILPTSPTLRRAPSLSPHLTDVIGLFANSLRWGVRDVRYFLPSQISILTPNIRRIKQPYQSQTETPTPTDAQITEILHPARPEWLRPYAEYTGSLDEGLYLRLCYDADKEEAHKSPMVAEPGRGFFVGPDGIIFDDKELFGGEGIHLATFLEIFPERVTNVGSVAHVELRIFGGGFTKLEGILKVKGRTDTPMVKGALTGMRTEDPLLRYGEYHAACVVTHPFIENEETLDGNGLLHVFLDDTGNVVRHWRTDDEGGDYDFDGTWKEGNWKEDFMSGRGELGASYREGGVRGPPYEL
ncbi:hypothetical protein Asppvi_002298 [Aspergillus pseudoviridinutans]|uniref:Uncharacterized protein n=1 Tax=Aspergillus pseudoviridinutans TaxID=1517512 RepID=A0A9P3B2R3_9EURO|nr:uncharacterized protein Asppvi_002298 [Aspergillus pseudoviridinutans]GIJ83476.1 hypothetical protein Asppvi_002298 [Aspergillus pseudoviridinutans]